MTQQRKRRRRLKKSVRRGCLGMLVLVVLAVGAYLSRGCYASNGGREEEHATLSDSLPDSRDSLLALRLARVVAATPRIDSAHVGLMFYDLTRRAPVLAHRADSLMVPASCQKLLTAISALHRLGSEHRFVSQLFMQGAPADSTLCGCLVLVADDDPNLESFDRFAAALRQLGIRRIEGDVYFDLARRDTLRPHPTASPWDIPFHTLPLLMRGEPFVRQQFLASLAASGIRLHRNPLFADRSLLGLSRKDAPTQYSLALKSAAGRGREVAREEHSLCDVLAPMIIFSDNARAEAVYYHADHFLDRWGAAPDADGQTVHRFLAQEMEGKVPEGMTVNDGSGLSPRNVTTARFLTDLLRYAYERPELCDPLMNRLLATPCDGERTGSLYGRGFDERFARRLYCKTGTLTARGISSLAGYLHSYDGRWYAFAIMNEQTPVYEARMFQEALCRSLLEQ